MHTEFVKALFYSLLFAIGGAPTAAMWIVRSQITDPHAWWQPFVGLSVIFACLLAPAILLQNVFLWLKRKHWPDLAYQPFTRTYLSLDIICLMSWLYFVFA